MAAFLASNVISISMSVSKCFVQSVSALRPGILNKCLQTPSPIPNLIPVRSKYIDCRMIREVKRRKVVKEFAKLRLQLTALKRNDILPEKLKEVAGEELHALPRDSCHTRLHKRCVLTSRARGRYRKFRMSRIIWRHLADYNQISGAERARWS